MNKQFILGLAGSLLHSHPDNLATPDAYLKHLGDVYDLAREVTSNILKHYQVPLTVEEIAFAAGLHDIGRPLQKDQTFHELRGAQFWEEQGTKKSFEARDVYRIAQMFRPHAFVYEFSIDPEFSHIQQEEFGVDTSLLLPRTWSEAIVAYSDKPLRITIYLGFLMAFFSFLIGCNFLFHTLKYGSSVAGWSSLIISLYFIGGIIIFILGIIGIYLGKTFDETKKRPLYIIQSLTFNEKK